MDVDASTTQIVSSEEGYLRITSKGSGSKWRHQVVYIVGKTKPRSIRGMNRDGGSGGHVTRLAVPDRRRVRRRTQGVTRYMRF
jgi:hypothetical protein